MKLVDADVLIDLSRVRDEAVKYFVQHPDFALLGAIEQFELCENREFVLSGSVVYVFCPNGYGSTKLNNNFFESKFKVAATTRNWKTVNELNRIAEKTT